MSSVSNQKAVDRICATLVGHQQAVWSVAFSPSGKLLVSASEDETIRLWDPATGWELAVLHGHQGGVNAVAFSRDGRQLASAGEDGVVTLWDLKSGTEVHRLTGHRGGVNSVAFSPDGRLLVSGGGTYNAPGEVNLWDAVSGG